MSATEPPTASPAAARDRTPLAPAAPEERVFGLDLLRTLAIAGVLAGHLPRFFEPVPKPWFYLYAGGFMGVELFFVLSGFLIGGILLRHGAGLREPAQLRRFWSRRWLRTLPNYGLFLGINLLLAPDLAPLLPRLGTYPVFLQNALFGGLDFFPESWSLAVEEWFYLLLPLSVCLLLRAGLAPRRAFVVSTAAFLLGPLLARCLHVAWNDPTWDDGVHRTLFFRLDAIMFGMIMAGLRMTRPEAWRRWRGPAAMVGLALCLAATGLFFRLDKDHGFFARTFFFSLTSLGFALLLPFADQWRTASRAPLIRATRATARWSYSLYLCNLPIFHLVVAWAGDTSPHPWMHRLGLAALTAALCFAAAAFLYRFLEKPILDRRRPELTAHDS